MYCLFEIGVFFSRFYVGKGRNREEENDAEAESEKTEEINSTARQGGCHMEYRMFDIGVNLTSSQFAKDRDDVVARALDAGVNGYSSPVLTSVKASRRKSWRVSIHPVGQRRAYILTTAASGKLRLKKRLLSWPRSQKWWRLVKCGLDFNRNFSTRKSRKRAFVCPATHCRRIKHAGIYALSRCPRAVYDIAGAVAG
ncbi:putative deoxyribonuclease [Escherichia coli]|uniref:Putative deoxyribonuclease n=1 Tax=Escherichia coli TaxID=562 RepID=A0A376MMM1_ECOLX|nr:putative deoxyribonuclease [Escherichia coli]